VVRLKESMGWKPQLGRSWDKRKELEILGAFSSGTATGAARLGRAHFDWKSSRS
jgi:hypothetical protein